MKTDHLSREELIRTLEWLERELGRWKNLYSLEHQKLQKLGALLTPYIKQHWDDEEEP